MLTTDRILQCRANIQALLAHHGLPQITTEEQEVDRIKGTAPPGFTYLLDSHANFRPFNAVKNHPGGIRGWREDTPRFSMQIILYPLERFGADVDIWNPDYGAGPALLHGFEMLWNRAWGRKTDAFKVTEALRKRGVAV